MSPREGRAAALGAALIVAALAWVALRAEVETESDVPAVRGSSFPWSFADGRAGVAEQAPAASAASASPADDVPHFEVCGFGRRALPPDEPASTAGALPSDDWPELEPAVAAAAHRIAAQLQGERDEHSRAIGLWLADVHERLLGQGTPSPAGSAPRAALVGLALRTRDAEVYARAWAACHPGSGPTDADDDDHGCERLSVAQWARLDPGNAVPWLWSLQRASAQRSQPELAEALYRIGRSTRFDHGFGRAPARILALEAAGLPSGLQALVAVSASGIESLNLPAFGALSQACERAALADANRRALCEAVAERLVDASGSKLALAVGIGFGKRLGWPAARVLALERQYREAAQALQARAPRDFASCDGVPALRSYFRNVAAYGELGAAREAMAAPAQ